MHVVVTLGEQDLNTSSYPELLLAECSSSACRKQQICMGLLRS